MRVRSGCAALLGLVLALPAAAPAQDRGGDAPPRGGGWSRDYQDALRRGRAHRAQRRRARGGDIPQAVGTILAYPMPPALIIRQTPETHAEIRNLLRALRGG